MARKTISNETLKQWLDIFFPNGYGKANKIAEYDKQFFVGWLKVGGASILDYPCEINLDGDCTAIVFSWWNNGDTEYTNDEVAAYLEGVMSQLAPDMQMDVRDTGSSFAMFQYQEEQT